MADPVQPSNPIMSVAASALRAQQSRMQVIAENLANSDSTATTPGGDPYRRRVAVFEVKNTPAGAKGVAMSHIATDQSDFHTVYAPGQPGADAKGYVKMPNVEPLVEALDMQNAQRAYQANLSIIENARAMDTATLAILQK
jgi:flagellar basal-body rod protein FlgC